MRNLKEILLEKLSRADGNELLDMVHEFDKVDDEIAKKFYDIAFPDGEPEAGLKKVFDRYDRYAEDVLGVLFDPHSSADEKTDQIEDMANDNERRYGTEPQFVVLMVEEFYKWAKKINLL